MEEQGIVEIKLTAKRPLDQEDALDEGNGSEKVSGAAAAKELDEKDEEGVPDDIKESTDDKDTEDSAATTNSAQQGGAAPIGTTQAKPPAEDDEGTGTTEKTATSQWLLESEILAFATQKQQAAEPVLQVSATDIMSKDATTDHATTDQQWQRDAVTGSEQSNDNEELDAQPEKQQQQQEQQHPDEMLSSEEDESSLDSSKKSEQYEAVVKSIRETLALSMDHQESESENDIEIETEIEAEAETPGNGATEKGAMVQSSDMDQPPSVPSEPAATEPTKNDATVSSPQNTDQSPSTEESKEDSNEKLTYRESLVKSLREKFEKGPEYDVNNLSVDMDEFYLAQRAQNANYKTKRREALSRIHGAEEVHGHGPGEVDHSSFSDVHSFDRHDAESKVDKDTDIEHEGPDSEVDTFVKHDAEPRKEEGKDMGDSVPDVEVHTFVENDAGSKVEEGKDMEDAGPDLEVDTFVENDSESKVEEGKDGEGAGLDVEADVDEMLAYFTELWRDEPGDLSENITSLLSFLSTGEGDAPVFPPQEIVDALRCRRLDFCGRRRNGQSEEKWVDTLLQQLCFNYLRDLEQQQIASRNNETMEATNPVDDFEVDEALSSLNSVLSDLESHIDALKSSKNSIALDGHAGGVQPRTAPIDPPAICSGEAKQQDFGTIDWNESLTRRTIGGGELYSASRWEMHDPACRLKNKIVLADRDEVETVAVVLKVDQEQHRGDLDSELCVLNNEKPSALKKRVSDGKNHRVKFMLKQESTGEGETDSNMRPKQPESSAICCWLC